MDRCSFACKVEGGEWRGKAWWGIWAMAWQPENMEASRGRFLIWFCQLEDSFILASCLINSLAGYSNHVWKAFSCRVLNIFFFFVFFKHPELLLGLPVSFCLCDFCIIFSNILRTVLPLVNFCLSVSLLIYYAQLSIWTFIVKDQSLQFWKICYLSSYLFNFFFLSYLCLSFSWFSSLSDVSLEFSSLLIFFLSVLSSCPTSWVFPTFLLIYLLKFLFLKILIPKSFPLLSLLIASYSYSTAIIFSLKYLTMLLF